MNGLIVNVYKNGTDCSNHGISAGHNQLTLIDIGKDCEIFEVVPDRPAIRLVKGALGSIIAVPVDQPKGKNGPMFGGNYIATSDSRFSRAIERMGECGYVAIPLHDRFETWEETEFLYR